MKPTYTPPQKIISLIDDNELVFEKELEGKDKPLYAYKYTKSLTKKNLHLLISEEGIKKGVKHGAFAI